jgi:hypothetical protein
MPFLTVEATLFPELTALGASAPQSVVQYIGNKRKLLDWIREQIPEGVKTVVDAFDGGGSVSYMLKREGFTVHSNDGLHWPHHIARAILVNQSETVTDEEIEALCQPNPKASTFVGDNYAGKLWKSEIHGVIDEVREASTRSRVSRRTWPWLQAPPCSRRAAGSRSSPQARSARTATAPSSSTSAWAR